MIVIGNIVRKYLTVATPLDILYFGGTMVKKIDILKKEMFSGNWRKALSIAAKFPRLGEHKDFIILAHEAYEHPDFYKSLGKNVEFLKLSGKKALIDRYFNGDYELFR